MRNAYARWRETEEAKWWGFVLVAVIIPAVLAMVA
jgi:hypothetical protein